MTRLKAFASNPVDAGGMEPKQFIALEYIESGTGRLLPGVELPEKSDPTAVAHQPGDVRFGKLRPYLAKSILMDSEGIGSGELLVLRPRPDVLDSRFLWYLTLSKPFIEWANVTSYGVKMPRTNWEMLGALEVSIPSLSEQHELVEFLNEKTAHIDELIAEQRFLVSLLEQRKWLTFVHELHRLASPEVAVRRGLDFITDGPFGSAFSSSIFASSPRGKPTLV